MDLLTQGVLGAALAQSVSKQTETRQATGIGLFAGLAADADILIRSSQDPLLTIEFHRHFTHSIFFIPLGALIVASIVWLLLRHTMQFKRIYLFALLGYSMSGFLDACTSYGTYLFWPLYQEAIALRIISIIDPVFTLILLISTGIAFYRRFYKPARVGLMLVCCYLLFGLFQLHRVESHIEQLAHQRGHIPQRLIAKPGFANLLLWRGIYEYDSHYHVDAVRAGLTISLYPGNAIKKFDPAMLEVEQQDTVLYRDIQRFNRFSQGYLAIHPDQENVLGDIRYAMLPNGIRPLWGIEFDMKQPMQHVRFRVFRKLDGQGRQRFLDMLFNR